jgi:hypothetical protein
MLGPLFGIPSLFNLDHHRHLYLLKTITQWMSKKLKLLFEQDNKAEIKTALKVALSNK